MKTITVHRSYKLKCYPSRGKFETCRYTVGQFRNYLNTFIVELWENKAIKISTKGKGALYNKALHVARGIVCAAQQTNKKKLLPSAIPVIKKMFSLSKITVSKNSKFDFWIRVDNSFSHNGINVPAKSHRALNKSLKEGWILSDACDLHFDVKNKLFYVIVRVKKCVAVPLITHRFIGIDVGLNHAYVSSDGYKSHGLKSLRKKMNKRIYIRQKFKIKSKKIKTELKQKLDRYAKEIVNRVNTSLVGLAFEAPRNIGRLSNGKLQGWSGAYLALRINVLARELSIYTHGVHPAYTSQTCPKCSYKSRLNRKGTNFLCKNCGHKNHADLVGSINIARRASGECKLNPATKSS